MQRKNVVKVVELYPKIYRAKYYDYKAKKVDNHYEVFRRTIEGEPWELYCRYVVVDGILFCCWTGLMASSKEG